MPAVHTYPEPSPGALPVVAIFDDDVEAGDPVIRDAMWTNPGEVAGNGVDDDGNGYADDVHGMVLTMDRGPQPLGSVARSHPVYGHGTGVASVIAAGADASPVKGVAAGKVQLLAVGCMVTVRPIDGFEEAVSYVLSLRARGGNIRVVNASMGYIEGDPQVRARWDAAVARLESAGILLVCAAGNEGKEYKSGHYVPSQLARSNVVSVAALDASGERLASWSSFGPATVQLAAPGEQVLVEDPWDGPSRASGTSLAAPHVSAAAALWFAKHPRGTAAEAKAALLRTADRLQELDGKVAAGRLNLERLLADP